MQLMLRNRERYYIWISIVVVVVGGGGGDDYGQLRKVYGVECTHFSLISSFSISIKRFGVWLPFLY